MSSPEAPCYRIKDLLVELRARPDELRAFTRILEAGLARQALLAPCGLPSPNWRGSGCHLAIHEGTQHLEALSNLERLLEAFQLDTDTWASWAPNETVADRRRNDG